MSRPEIVALYHIVQVISAPQGLAATWLMEDNSEIEEPVLCLALVQFKEYFRNEAGTLRETADPPWEQVFPIDLGGEPIIDVKNFMGLAFSVKGASDVHE